MSDENVIYEVNDLDDNAVYEFPQGTTRQEVVDFFKRKDADKKLSTIGRVSLGVKAGLADTLAGISRLIAPAEKKLGLPDWINKQAQAQATLDESNFELSEPNAVEKLIPGATQLATSFAATGGAEGMLEKLIVKYGAKNASKIYNLINKNVYTKIASKAAKAAPQGAAFGLVTADQNESLGDAAAVGAVAGSLGSAAIDSAATGIKSLTKYNALKKIAQESGATTEEIKQAVKSAGGVTPLAGEALKNPNVNKLEQNTLPYLLGFQQKAREKLAGMGKKLVEQGNSIYNKLTVNLTKSERSDAIKKLLDENKARLDAQSKLNYSENNKIAKTVGAEITPTNFAKTAKRLKKSHGEVFNDLGISSASEAKTALQKILNQVFKKDSGGIDVATGKRLPKALKNTSLQTANYAKSSIGKKAYSAKVKGDAEVESIYNQLYAALKQDIEDGINNSNSKELKDSYRNAEKFYKENIVPLKDNKVWGALTGKIDSNDIIKTFLSGDQGKLNLLQKLLNNAPNSEKLILTEALSNSLGENILGENYVNPAKLSSILNKIGKDRLSMLVKNNEDLADIKDFRNNLVNASDTLNMMFNPKTGYSNMANINFFESGKIAESAINDFLKGNHLGILSKLGAYGSKLSEARAINDNGILDNIIKLRNGDKIDKGMYGKAEKLEKSGIPLSKILTYVINSNSS